MTCLKCKKELETIRHLTINCDFDLNSLGIPFKKVSIDGFSFFILDICSECRNDYLDNLIKWYHGLDKSLSDIARGSKLFVRINGIMTEVSEKEWDRMYPSE